MDRGMISAIIPTLDEASDLPGRLAAPDSDGASGHSAARQILRDFRRRKIKAA
jgi:hypothetical protein